MDFHCVARKLKWILTLKLHVPMTRDEALGVVQYCSINEIQYSFKFRPLLEIIVQNITEFKF